MKDSRTYTLVYATVLGVACAFLLSLARDLTATARDANARAEEVRHILGVLKVSYPKDAPSSDLVGIFEANVTKEERAGTTLYKYSPAQSEGTAARTAFAIPFSGPGLWGTIKGFLALESDMQTIRGVTFHEQEETPGLGGEIATACSCVGQPGAECAAWFRHQFKGKRITDVSGRPGIHIRPGRSAERGPNEVDGITGATMTCSKVEAMLNTAIGRIVEER